MTQRQDSLTDQMAEILQLAVDAGCYDAHGWIVRAWGRSADSDSPPSAPSSGGAE
jgi:hypothetical protein